MFQLVVMKQRSADSPVRSPDPGHGWRILAALGLVVAVIGWADVILGWFPLQFGNPEWEFGTVSTTFDGLPLATIGMTLVVAGLVAGAGSRPGTLRAAAVALWLVALFVVAVFAVYLMDVPLARRGVAEPLRPTLMRSVLRTSLFGVVYFTFFSWLGWFAWRRAAPAGRERDR